MVLHTAAAVLLHYCAHRAEPPAGVAWVAAGTYCAATVVLPHGGVQHTRGFAGSAEHVRCRAVV